MKKEPLSIMIVKTLLAVVIFIGMWTIIISGAYLIGGYGKIKTPVFRGPGIFIDGHFKGVSNLELPIDITEAAKIVEKFCGTKNPDYKYSCTKTGMKKVDGEWRIPIINLNCPCYATINIETGKTICMRQIPFEKKEVTITTDKTKYELGEMVKITVENNLNNPIKHLKSVGCGLQGFSNGEWINVSSKSCIWEGEIKLKSNSEYNFNWTSSRWGLEKYRIAFYYQEQKTIETKEIGKIICEGKKFPDELEELLLNGKWAKGDNKGCAMCDACFVCSCTIKNAWAIDGTVIDAHLVSCGGNSYTIKHKGEEYGCESENYKSLYEQASLYPKIPENWETIYSNEFTIKEKSALDLRCSEKVKGIGGINGIDCTVVSFGYEFDSVTEKCVMRAVNGCSFKTPFKSLEECQEVCEKKSVVVSDKITVSLKVIIEDKYKSGNSNDSIEIAVTFLGKPTEVYLKKIQDLSNRKLVKLFEDVYSTSVSAKNILSIGDYDFIKKIEYFGGDIILE